MTLSLSRRHMLVGLGTAGAAVGLPAAAGFVGRQLAPHLELVDAGLLATRPDLVASVFGGRTPETVGPEPVRAWRDGLGRRIADSGQATVLARYDQLIQFRGLAREAGLRFVSRPLGRGVFHMGITRPA